MRHLAARIGAVLVAVATVGWGAPARADVPGFAVRMGQAPATFTIGKAARTLTAVASTERAGRRCLKVRWALIVSTRGVSLDQIRVQRVENDESFAVRARVDEEAVRVVDVRTDPGELCRDRTVTARWDVAFTGPDDGEARFEARAFDATGRLLSTSGAEARVVTPVAARPTPSKSPSASPSPSATEESATAEEAAEDEPTAATSTEAAALTPAAGSSNVLGVGLIVGALMVFLGVGMLLRIRARNRRGPAWQTETQPLPTGFNSMPRRRR